VTRPTGASPQKDVYVLGIAATVGGRQPERSFSDLVREAYLGALADARMPDPAFTHAWFSNLLMDFWGQSAGKGHAALTPLIREGLFPAGASIVNVEAGCASASVAFHGAIKDVRSGETDVGVAIGVEKMTDPQRPGGYLDHMNRALDQLDPDAWQELYENMANEAGVEFAPAPGHSIPMDIYAVWAHSHMRRYGTTPDQIAAAAAKCHTNAVDNPRAQYRFPMSVDDVLADRMVADPLTRAMCAPTGDAAAAVIVCSKKYLDSQPPEVRERSVRIRGHALGGGIFDVGWEDERAPIIASRKAFAEAGMTVDDVDLVELHDASSFAEIHLIEDLGLCPRGEGGPYTAAGATARHGQIPVNPSGGLVSRGHPIGATGIMMLNEIVLQLRGEAGDIQIPGASVGLAENGGGIMGNDVALCSVTILERAG
jgi:acetyl-CoA acetyltransferase